MINTTQTNFQRIGKKIAESRIEKESNNTQSTASFSLDTKMNHDKRAEKGKKILKDILSRV